MKPGSLSIVLCSGFAWAIAACGGGSTAPTLDVLGDEPVAVETDIGLPDLEDGSDVGLDGPADVEGTFEAGELGEVPDVLDPGADDSSTSDGIPIPDGYTQLPPLDAYAGDPNSAVFDGFDLGVDLPADVAADIVPKQCDADGQCDDGVYCNGTESCKAGACTPGVNPCDDQDPTTVDACVESTHACQHDHPPIAFAADLVVKTGAQARLDATGSTDPDGDFVTVFQWAILAAPSGSKSQIEPSNEPIAFITPDIDGIYYLGVAVQANGLWSEVHVVRVFAVTKTFAWLDTARTTTSVPEMLLALGLNFCIQFNQTIDSESLLGGGFTAVTDNPKVEFKGGSGSGDSEVCGTFRPSKGRFADLSVGDHVLGLGTAKGLVTGDTLSFAVEMTVSQPPPPDPDGPIISNIVVDPTYYPGLKGRFVATLLDPQGDVASAQPFVEEAFLAIEKGCVSLLGPGIPSIAGYDDGTHGDEVAGDRQFTFPFTPSSSLTESGQTQCTFESALRVHDEQNHRGNAYVFSVVVKTK